MLSDLRNSNLLDGSLRERILGLFCRTRFKILVKRRTSASIGTNGDLTHGQPLTFFSHRFQCCGYNSPHDRPIPSSTCPGMTTPSAYAAAGCKETIVATLADWREYILATGLVLLAIKVLHGG